MFVEQKLSNWPIIRFCVLNQDKMNKKIQDLRTLF